MSLVQDYHRAHKERLARMSIPPQKKGYMRIAARFQRATYIISGYQKPPYKIAINEDTTKLNARLTCADIVAAVARFYRISVTDLLSHRKHASVTNPRQVAMYLAKILTPNSFVEIGRRMGDRDHTTVMHAVAKIQKLLAGGDDKLADQIAYIRKRLAGW